ncbi:MAG: sulfite exporter TauE/SafE family protein [Oscillospiraceae bacterium]|nr:sulfite exporter TauE/SafE family protein [Oscillospiraceae bacterium]
MKEWFLPFLLGAATGVLSAWGVGGGTLLLLCMTLFLGVDQVEAQGINLLYFLPAAAVSLPYHRKNGYLDTNVLRSAAPLGTVCALAAAMISTSVDITIFRKPFGLFLLYAGVSMLLGQRKKGE